MVKIRFCGLLAIGSLLYLMTSCVGVKDIEIDEWKIYNAQIASFYIYNDDMPELENVRFTIDQLNGQIYNADSMNFRTVIRNKVLVELEAESLYGVANIFFIEQSTGDTIFSTVDSVDFTAPILIVVTAYDGVTTKTYEAKLNIHQVDPDAMTWTRHADILPGRTFTDMKMLSSSGFCYMYVVENSVNQLYRSDIRSMVNWEILPMSGFPARAILPQMTEFADRWVILSEEGKLYSSIDGQEWIPVEMGVSIKSVLGYLPANTLSARKDVLCCIAEIEGVLRFVSIDKQWAVTTGRDVQANFPLSGFGQFHYETMYYPRLVIAFGRDSRDKLSNIAWATMDGLLWASLTNPQAAISPRENVTVFYYDDCFFAVGGINELDEALNDIYISKDQGISWINSYKRLIKDSDDDYDDEHENIYDEDSDSHYYYYNQIYYMLDDEYQARGFTSVWVDKNDYIWLFGGKAKKETNILSEIWRGRITRLGFGKN